MRAKVIGFFVLVFVCSSSAPILAEQRSDQPAPPKAHAESSPEKVNAAKMKLNSRREKDRIARPGGEANACVRRYLTENATPGYDANQLGMEACAVCAREIRDAADADIADARAKIADERFREAFLEARSNLAANCDLSEFATIAIKQKEAAVSERLPIAISCVEKHAMTFALATSESPENIAMAAFNKCRNVFRAAAEAGVNRRPGAAFWVSGRPVPEDPTMTRRTFALIGAASVATSGGDTSRAMEMPKAESTPSRSFVKERYVASSNGAGALKRSSCMRATSRYERTLATLRPASTEPTTSGEGCSPFNVTCWSASFPPRVEPSGAVSSTAHPPTRDAANAARTVSAMTFACVAYWVRG